MSDLVGITILLKGPHALEVCASQWCPAMPEKHPFIGFLKEYGVVQSIDSDRIHCQLPEEWLGRTAKYHLVKEMYRGSERIFPHQH